MTTASELAKHILARFEANGAPITNLKLQKLLYYTQAWNLALHDSPVFDDRIEAWVHGPVVPTVFREYRDFKWTPITGAASCSGLPNNLLSHLEEVLAEYGQLNPWDLERMTHNEEPWKAARGTLPPDLPSNAVISQESMKKFYRSR